VHRHRNGVNAEADKPLLGGRQTLRPFVPSTKDRLDVQLDSLSADRRTLQSGLSAQIRKQ
jgi:hypothetical protein